MKITHKEITALTKKHPASEVLTYAQVDAMADLIAEQDAEIKRQAELIAKYQKHVEIIKDDAEPSVGDLIQWLSSAGRTWEQQHTRKYLKSDIRLGFWEHLKHRGSQPRILIQLANGKYAVRESDFNNNQQGE
jgi:hypothetical protein